MRCEKWRRREGDRMPLPMRAPIREAPGAGSSSHQQLLAQSQAQQEASWAIPWVPQGSLGPGEAPNLPLDCTPARPDSRATVTPDSPSHPIPVLRVWGGGSHIPHIGLRQRWLTLGGVQLTTNEAFSRSTCGCLVQATHQQGRGLRHPCRPQGLREDM